MSNFDKTNKEHQIALYEFFTALRELTDKAYALSHTWEKTQDKIEDFEELILDANYPKELNGSFDEITHSLGQYTENIEQLFKKISK